MSTEFRLLEKTVSSITLDSKNMILISDFQNFLDRNSET